MHPQEFLDPLRSILRLFLGDWHRWVWSVFTATILQSAQIIDRPMHCTVKVSLHVCSLAVTVATVDSQMFSQINTCRQCSCHNKNISQCFFKWTANIARSGVTKLGYTVAHAPAASIKSTVNLNLDINKAQWHNYIWLHLVQWEQPFSHAPDPNWNNAINLDLYIQVALP